MRSLADQSPGFHGTPYVGRVRAFHPRENAALTLRCALQARSVPARRQMQNIRGRPQLHQAHQRGKPLSPHLSTLHRREAQPSRGEQ
jgi:hypothetical protein